MSDMRPVDPELMRRLEAAGHDIAETLERAIKMWTGDITQEKIGFTLMIFSFNGPEFTYISNARREDMIKTMQEFIAANPPPMTWDEQHG